MLYFRLIGINTVYIRADNYVYPQTVGKDVPLGH